MRPVLLVLHYSVSAGAQSFRRIESAAKEILESTAYETVITGIDVSDYRDGERDISDLLYAVKDADTRIRFSSMEESMITPRFLDACKALKNFAPQFHLSLQSGSDAVLKSMNRKYTRAQYLEKCRMIYEAFGRAAITTDIIVGFPDGNGSGLREFAFHRERSRIFAGARVSVFPARRHGGGEAV